jgi:hypothetical protein
MILISHICIPYRGKVIRDNTATNQALFPAFLYGNLALVQSRITGPNAWPWMVDYCAVHCGVKVKTSTHLKVPTVLHVERDELDHPGRQSNSTFCGVTTC